MKARKAVPSRGLGQIALRVAELLGEEHLLVDAGALAMWGVVRAAKSLAFVTRLDPAEVRRRLLAGGLPSSLKRRESRGEMSWQIRGKVGGVGFEILPAAVPLDFSHAVSVPFEGAHLQVVDLDGLIRMKLKAAGPADLTDVAMLLKRHPQKEAAALKVAEAYGLGEELKAAVADPEKALRRDGSKGRQSSGRRARGRAGAGD
jgi:hypothetical protein